MTAMRLSNYFLWAKIKENHLIFKTYNRSHPKYDSKRFDSIKKTSLTRRVWRDKSMRSSKNG